MLGRIETCFLIPFPFFRVLDSLLALPDSIDGCSSLPVSEPVLGFLEKESPNSNILKAKLQIVREVIKEVFQSKNNGRKI